MFSTMPDAPCVQIVAPRTTAAFGAASGPSSRAGRDRTSAGGSTRPPDQLFQPLPPPTGQPPFRLELASVLGQPAVDGIEQAGTLVLHAVGDTGGVTSPSWLRISTVRDYR